METVPLAYAQKFINVLMTRLGPAAPELYLVTCVRVRGQFDPNDFERAAAVLAQRHPVICARLDRSGNELVQRQERLVPSVETIELGGDADKDADVVLSALADRPFDLFHENPFRIIVGRASPDEAFLLLQGHHIFIDALSLDLLLEDYLSIFRGDDQAPREACPEDTESSFFSWARQEKEMTSDGTFAGRAQGWLKRLHDADPVLHLRDRRAEPAVQSVQSISFELGPQQFQQFVASARRLRVSNFVLAATAVFSALREVTDQESILLSVVSGVRRPPFERTVGQFAELFMIKQHAHDIELPEQAARLISKEIMHGIFNYIPMAYLLTEVNWLRRRIAKGFAMTEVFIDYFQPPADLGKSCRPDECEISAFPITARAHPASIPYHGILAGFFFLPKKDSIDVRIDYEPAIVSAEVAGKISASLQHFLTQ